MSKKHNYLFYLFGTLYLLTSPSFSSAEGSLPLEGEPDEENPWLQVSFQCDSGPLFFVEKEKEDKKANVRDLKRINKSLIAQQPNPSLKYKMILQRSNKMFQCEVDISKLLLQVKERKLDASVLRLLAATYKFQDDNALNIKSLSLGRMKGLYSKKESYSGFQIDSEYFEFGMDCFTLFMTKNMNVDGCLKYGFESGHKVKVGGIWKGDGSKRNLQGKLTFEQPYLGYVDGLSLKLEKEKKEKEDIFKYSGSLTLKISDTTKGTLTLFRKRLKNDPKNSIKIQGEWKPANSKGLTLTGSLEYDSGQALHTLTPTIQFKYCTPIFSYYN